ncbi:MAG: S-layer homology domain-containing protein [Firmicutes bacterium]|nr:S-layer homology domain-containing protein [Bacillota bacterium]
MIMKTYKKVTAYILFIVIFCMDEVVWAKNAVNYFKSKEYISGDGENCFRPNSNITREEFATLLITTFEYEINTSDGGFTDTTTESWYYDYVASAKHYGISDGKNDGSFGVGENITRADMAVMSYRAYLSAKGDLPIKNAATVFKDFYAIPEYAVNAVSYM